MEPLRLKPNSKLNLALDLRVVCLILLAIIVGMFAVWQPWRTSANANDRTVEVTGETTIKSEPDQYTFYPTYEFSAKDKAAASKQADDKSTEVVTKLKQLGVESKNIKTSINGYNDTYLRETSSDTSDFKYTLSVTIVVDSLDQAQKVQDYLATTSPLGSVTPNSTFSEKKRKQVESQARDEATKDARSKAEQNAKNLGFKIGKVKSVTDGQGFSVMPYAMDAVGASGTVSVGSGAKTMVTSSAIQPGQNDLTYSVTVTYYVK